MKPHLILVLVFVFKHQFAYSQKCEIPPNDAYANCIVSKNLKDYSVKTVQGEFYSFKSDCLYTLLSYESNNGDQITVDSGKSKIEITIGAKQYEIELTGKKPIVFKTPVKTYSLPVTVGDIDCSKPGEYAVVKFKKYGLTVKWNGKETVVIQVDNPQQYDFSGICSKDCTESSPSLREQWKLTDKCVDDEPGKCLTVQDRAKSLQYCRGILRNRKYNKCLKVLNVDSFLSECQAVFCGCKKPKVEMCMCELFDGFVKHCEARTGEAISWREKNFCEKTCKIPNQVYHECGRRQKACGIVVENEEDEKTCIEGCRCPLNLFLSNQKCIAPNECPCRYDNVDYPPGSKTNQDCNTCTCNGNAGWDCTKDICYVDADVTGDPHYTTFDGKRYDFMGKCVYYLVKGLDFFITADHYVWQGGAFVKNFKSAAPSWTKAVGVHYGDNVIALKPNLVITFNGKPLTKFPHKEGNITISKPTGSKLIVELPNYLQVHWDGQTTAKIRAPTTLRGYLQGLMGNFNKNPNDDFVLPNGDTTQDPNVFGHSWKVEGSCDEENTDPIPDPCKDNPAHKRTAEKACSVLNGNLFTGCKEYNSKESYDSCVYDCCHAADLGDKCACEIIASHAGRCLNKVNQWRKQVPACEIKCPAGLVYNYCLNPCESSCDYIAVNPTCQKQCLEGCGCPQGKTLDENNKCVEIENCKCKLNGQYFQSGYKIKDDAFIKTCTKGKWVQSPNKDPNNNKIKSIEELKAKCKNIKNSVYAPCKSSKPLTCQNMDQPQDEPANKKCEEGCECEEGFLLDTKSNSCVLPKDCPCFFNGKSYDNLAERKIINGKCICKTNKWECIKKDNAIEKCSIFGDSIRNFDGNIISFNSGCEFILANGEFNKKPYAINVKSGEVFISYTDDDNNNVEIEVKKNDATFNNQIDFQSTKVVALDAIGIQIIWTKEGYHLKFESENIENVVGLCEKLKDPDSLKNTERLTTYIDSFNNDANCFDAIIIPTNKETYDFDGKPTPNKCDVLKGPIFESCTKDFPVDEYFKTCVISAQNQENPEDTDDMYCSIFSTLAQECTDIGNPIKWRSPDLCPIDCPAKTVYSNCINLCSCGDIEKNGVCPEKPCIEGCVKKKCDAGFVFKNGKFDECVTIKECSEIKCLRELDNYDDNCNCEDGKVVCAPIVVPTVTTPTTEAPTQPSTKPPTKPPTQPPTQPPTKPPTQPPTQPPTKPPTQPTTKSPTQPPINYEPTKEQTELFDDFNYVQEMLERLKKNPSYNSLSPKEKEMLEMFNSHIIEFEGEVNCQRKIRNIKNCKCVNSEEVCNPNFNNERENDHEISNNLELIRFMKQHLKCLEDEFNDPQNCTCINGKKMCPEKKVLTPSTSKPTPIRYFYNVNCERQVVVSLYNVQLAKKGQNCYKELKENPMRNCVCIDEQLVCDAPLPNPEKNVTLPKEVPLEVYNEYLNDAKAQLQCQARIAKRPEVCWCEKGTEVCEKKPQPIPERDSYEIIDEYKETTINRNEIYDQFHKGLECTEELGEDSQVCTCLNGEKECFDMDFDGPIEAEPSDDDETKYPDPAQKIVTVIEETEPKIVCLRKKNLGPNCAQYRMTHVKPTQEDVAQLNIYHQYIRHINDQLNCLRNKPSYCLCVNRQQKCSFKEVNMRDIKGIERKQIIIYTKFLEHINSQMECLARLNRRSTGCFCDNGQQKCEQDKNYVIYPLFDNHVLEEYDEGKKFREIEDQLECFNELKSLSMKCSCRNGVVECDTDEEDLRRPEPNDDFTKLKRNIPEQLNTITTIDRKMYCFVNNDNPICRKILPKQKIAPIISQDDKQLLKIYGNYFDHIELQLRCFGNITSPNCMCSNGKLVCGVEIENMPDRRIKVANILKTYALFIKYVETQLDCVASLNDDQCNCGTEKICGGFSRRNKFISLIDDSIYNNANGAYWNINSQLKCLSELSNDNHRQCYCSNGLMICDEFERSCPEIKCPKNSRLIKKCEDCCPECETEHCLAPTILENGTQTLISKQLDETWMENICKECYCKKDDLGMYIQCIQYICPLPNSQDILYKYVNEEGKCCPQAVQIGCKHEGKSYPLGSIISKTLCETLSCVKNRHGDIVKQIHKTICSPCPKGFNYTPSTTNCCGECTAMGCMYNNEIKQLGDVWFSDDKCYKMRCTQENGKWILSRHRKICRPVRYCDGIIEKRECCNYCNTSGY